MAVASAPVHANPLPSPALRRFAWGVLAYFIAVILWGTRYARHRPGDGCGNHWPLCNGTVHAALAAHRHHHRVHASHHQRHLVLLRRRPAALDLSERPCAGTWRGPCSVASVGFTLVEAILGALLVKLGLTAQSQSPLRAPYLALHFTNTLLLVAALTLTAHMLSRRTGYLRGNVRLVAPVGAVAAVVLLLADRRRHRLAGRAGRHAFSRHLIERCAAPGFFCHQRVAGALALDASYRRPCWHACFSSGLWSRRAAQNALG